MNHNEGSNKYPHPDYTAYNSFAHNHVNFIAQ